MMTKIRMKDSIKSFEKGKKLYDVFHKKVKKKFHSSIPSITTPANNS